MIDQTVLVVDDDESCRNVVAMILDKYGYEVILARDGFHAMDIFDRQAESIDAVLLDVAMPGLNGEETFKRMTSIRSDIPIIMVTGMSKDAVIDRLSPLMPAGFIQKPFTISTLVDHLHRVIAKTPEPSRLFSKMG